jgi:conserved oligomeric Golgi complex subunit 7
MRNVRGDIQKVNQDTADSMKNLIELDLVKNRVQSASKALQEADNWVTLSAQIDEVFETKDAAQVCHLFSCVASVLHS